MMDFFVLDFFFSGLVVGGDATGVVSGVWWLVTGETAERGSAAACSRGSSFFSLDRIGTADGLSSCNPRSIKQSTSSTGG